MSVRRVIKFRMWHFSEKKMIAPDNLVFLFGETEDYLLLQFTGLRDKNGTEIYEGDIVDVRTNAPVAVEWDTLAAGWKPWTEYNESVPLPGQCPDDIEVIGNIYQHPELMEGQP